LAYATWNPSDKHASLTLSNGNLTATHNPVGTNWFSARSTAGKAAGKWYWEASFSGTTSAVFGIGTSAHTLASFPGNGAAGRGYYGPNGQKFVGNTPSAYGASYAAGDVVGVALDMDAGTVEFFKNGVSQGVAFTGLTGTFYAMAAVNTDNGSFTANFGATAFTHAVPSGFSAGLTA
jgi:hypothetical protein